MEVVARQMMALAAEVEDLKMMGMVVAVGVAGQHL